MYIFTTLEFPTHNSDFQPIDNECKCQILLLIYPQRRHYHLINVYTELAPKLSATASVAQW